MVILAAVSAINMVGLKIILNKTIILTFNVFKMKVKYSLSSFVQTLKQNGWNCLLKSVVPVRKTVTTWMFFRVKCKR
jgi:hypothetical protein